MWYWGSNSGWTGGLLYVRQALCQLSYHPRPQHLLYSHLLSTFTSHLTFSWPWDKTLFQNSGAEGRTKKLQTTPSQMIKKLLECIARLCIALMSINPKLRMLEWQPRSMVIPTWIDQISPEWSPQKTGVGDGLARQIEDPIESWFVWGHDFNTQKSHQKCQSGYARVTSVLQRWGQDPSAAGQTD